MTELEQQKEYMGLGSNVTAFTPKASVCTLVSPLDLLLLLDAQVATVARTAFHSLW